MLKVRIIPTILISNSSVVKTIQYKNPRIVGDAISTIKVFSKRMADEMIIVDIEAYKNGINFDLITNYTKFCNMPLTVGGGINTIDDAQKIFELGVEKIILNSSFFYNNKIINQISKKFGSSSVVFSLDVREDLKGYKIHSKSGNNLINDNIYSIIKNVISEGAGEIVLNSISRDGTYKGYDLELFKIVNEVVNVPIVLSSGCGTKKDCLDAFNVGAKAIAAGSIFFWIGESIVSIKQYLKKHDINVRIT